MHIILKLSRQTCKYRWMNNRIKGGLGGLTYSGAENIFESIWILGLKCVCMYPHFLALWCNTQPAQWKTLSESDMCADCEPDPGECCKISVQDKTQNWNFTITEGQAGHALLAALKRKNIWILKRVSFHFASLLLSWYEWIKSVSSYWNKT